MSPIAVQAGHVIGTSARLPRHRAIVTVLHAYCGYICKRYKFYSVQRYAVSLFAIGLSRFSLSLSARARGYRPFVPSAQTRLSFHVVSLSPRIVKNLLLQFTPRSFLPPLLLDFFFPFLHREKERVCR